MSENPRVSIGLPVYNGADFIDETLKSLTNQTFEDLEIVISDNGSEDGTEQICRRWAEADSRIRYLRYRENRGAAWNFNNVFEHSRGDYFHWAAHDDLLEPDFIGVCARVLDANAEVVLSHTHVSQVDELGRSLAPWSEYVDVSSPDPGVRLRNALRDWMCLPVFGLIRTAALKQTGLIRPFHASDRLLLAELAIQGRFHLTPQPLFVHRQHPGMSGIAYHGPYRRGAWWDPARRSAQRWPHWIYYFNVAKMIIGSRLAPMQKGRSLTDLLTLMAREWKQLVFDIYRPLRNRISGKPAY